MKIFNRFFKSSNRLCDHDYCWSLYGNKHIAEKICLNCSEKIIYDLEITEIYRSNMKVSPDMRTLFNEYGVKFYLYIKEKNDLDKEKLKIIQQAYKELESSGEDSKNIKWRRQEPGIN